MEASREKITSLVQYVSRDPQAEMECKVLSGQIQTKDVADRLIEAIGHLTVGSATEEHRATFSYPDGIRVVVTEPENILKVCQSNSFRGTKLYVERKTPYFEGKDKDSVDLPDHGIKFTLRREEQLRKDFTGSPIDPLSHVRVMHRKSWKTGDGLLQIDLSLVKSRSKEKREKTLSEVLRKNPLYELEIEVLNRKAPVKAIVDSMFRNITAILGAFQNSPFLLSKSDIDVYRNKFKEYGVDFVNPITMDRIHMMKTYPHSVLSGYTVTVKADGRRCFLFVHPRDRRVLLVTPGLEITWTGMTASKDIHNGTILDGEYLEDLNLFCIFDVYIYRGKNTMRLPLMTTDEDILTKPTESRLGCAHEFASKDVVADFIMKPSAKPFRIETKLFYAGDGPKMEEAINSLLDKTYAYPTDGLVFTPRASAVAPTPDRDGKTWLRVYKWKPADQNSIDFLVRYKTGDAYDTVLRQRVFKGMLYVSRRRSTKGIYPRETVTGEYVQPTLPTDFQKFATKDVAPSPFQPTNPSVPEAYNIMIPLNADGVPVDKTGARIEDNTIIECSYDRTINRWVIMRTRYDKTLQYRNGAPQFGNSIVTAESIWTNIHNPVTEHMIRHCSSEPIQNIAADDVYYRDTLRAGDRILKTVYAFHNRIKEKLYKEYTKPGDTLLELAMGRGGDFQKWRWFKLSKVVGVDIVESNLTAPRQGAYARYLEGLSKSDYDKLPPALFVVGDMTKPFYENDDRYINILAGREPAQTTYLEQFAGLSEFNAISCQFAMHYACGSEEDFGAFTQNLTTHGKEWFFGTCMDGAAVYALLLGKKNHIFRSAGRVFGEFTKEYPDGDTFTEEFGQAIQVHLESFEKPIKEFLVPFARVTEVLQAAGYELVFTALFSEYYDRQTEITLSQEEQAFSFLNRSFAFRRVKTAPPSPPEEEPSIELPVTTDAEVVAKPKRKMIKMKIPKTELPQEEPVLFYGADESKGEFRFMSNFYVAPFEVDGVTFPTVEHYFQWSKAKLMGDEASATKMLTPPKNKTQVEPKTVKALGAKVKDFDQTKWDGAKNEIMEKAVRAKFTHPKNKELLEKLLATKNRPIGEASPRDAYWGIGTSAETTVAKNPAKWKGQNTLGKLLMALRKEFREGGASPTHL